MRERGPYGVRRGVCHPVVEDQVQRIMWSVQCCWEASSGEPGRGTARGEVVYVASRREASSSGRGELGVGFCWVQDKEVRASERRVSFA